MFRFDRDKYNSETALSRTHGFETLGPIVVVLAVFMAVRFVLAAWSVPFAAELAAAAGGVLVVAWVLLRISLRRRAQKKASKLRAKLSELEQQEFALRFQEAKLNGQLDHWDNADETARTDKAEEVKS